MSKRFAGGIAGLLTALALIAVPTASAATEFGDNCVGNEGTEFEGTTLFAITASGNTLPLTAPSAGVITKLKVNLVPTPLSIPQTLQVLRPTGAEQIQVIGQAPQSIIGGSNSFDARIPVQAGDRLGLLGTGELGNLICEFPGGPENIIGGFEGAAVGTTTPFDEVQVEARLPISAVLEPDVDRDGFGDETQDKCPQNAAVQAPCPVIPPVTLSASSVAKKSLVTVLITSNAQAPVTVGGTVKVGKKPATLSGGTQIVAPGTIAKFTLLFPKALKAKLKLLSPKQSLSLAVTATTTNSAGQPSNTSLKVKLKGQAKPKRHAKAKAKA